MKAVLATMVMVTTVVVVPLGAAHAASGHQPVAGLHPGNESFFAPPPALFLPSSGGVVPRRPTCRPGQIEAVAFTEHSPDGVMGVVELKGMKIYHKKPWGRLRCSLSIVKGPQAFVAANGEALDVPRGRENTTNPAANSLAWRTLEAGRAAMGFGWFGTYCGDAPRYVVMKLRGGRGLLRVPYDGPTPACPADPAGAASMLTVGTAGGSRAPVQPAPPSFLNLTTSARFLGPTTHDAPAPVEVTISNTSDQAVALVPCPIFSVQTKVTIGGHVRSASAVIDNRSPGCKQALVTVQPGQPIVFRLNREELSPGTRFGAPSGSTYDVAVGLAGMPTATVSTTVG
ncbi:MAG TPA: hypothetical protein VHE57_02280 [Mycobacteriales bacterium]|nr:hypothetical protein [Mycobacteriales bacterium]